MNYLMYFALMAAVLIGLNYWVNWVEKTSVVKPPRHIAVSQMGTAKAQDIYNWVCYATRLLGNAYLEQLVWCEVARSDMLLMELCTLTNAGNEERRLQRMREIGKDFGLDTSVVDQPI